MSVLAIRHSNRLSRIIEGRCACGGERVLDGLWATYIPGALGAGRLASDCNGGIGCARAAGAGRDEHTLTP